MIVVGHALRSNSDILEGNNTERPTDGKFGIHTYLNHYDVLVINDHPDAHSGEGNGALSPHPIEPLCLGVLNDHFKLAETSGSIDGTEHTFSIMANGPL